MSKYYSYNPDWVASYLRRVRRHASGLDSLGVLADEVSLFLHTHYLKRFVRAGVASPGRWRRPGAIHQR